MVTIVEETKEGRKEGRVGEERGGEGRKEGRQKECRQVNTHITYPILYNHLYVHIYIHNTQCTHIHNTHVWCYDASGCLFSESLFTSFFITLFSSFSLLFPDWIN
jgi:hypothetical protein